MAVAVDKINELILSMIYGIFGMIFIVKYVYISKNEECCHERHPIMIDIIIVISIFLSALRSFATLLVDGKLLDSLCLFGLEFGLFVALSKYLQHLYHVYYETNFSNFAHKKKWKLLINNSGKNSNWYVRHKHTWGNIHYTNRILNPVIFISGSIVVIFEVFIQFSKQPKVVDAFRTAWIGYFICYGILVLTLVKLCRNIITFDDTFLVIRQFKYVGICLLVMIVFVIIDVFIKVIAKDFPAILVINQIIFDVVFWTSVFGIISINTVWVMKYVIPNTNNETIMSTIADSNKEYTTTDIFGNSNAIDLMMDHLSFGILLTILHPY